jgi:hypothetical protein
MTKNLTNRKPKTWNLLTFSSGEVGLGAYMAQAGIVQKGGQEVRMPDIPAVPFGSAFGVFETIHGAESSKEFAEKLEAACLKHHGSAIDEFLIKLTADRQDQRIDGVMAARVFNLAKQLASGTIGAAVSRVANRFALVQIALEVAHSYHILPFPVEHIGWSVKKMFADWLTNRGGDGSIEIKNACDRIQHLLVSNEFSDRVYDPRKADGQIVRNLLGYRLAGFEGELIELLIPIAVFDKEIAIGVSKPQLIAELQSRGWLEKPGNDGRAYHNRRICGKLTRFYVFSPLVFQNSENPLVSLVSLVSVAETVPQNDTDLIPPDTSEKIQLVSLVSEENLADTSYTSEKNGLVSTGITQNVDRASILQADTSDTSDTSGKTHFPKTGGKNLKVGDRVKYIGGMVKYANQLGEVTKVRGGNLETTFTTRSHGSIPVAEVEAI